MHFFPNCVLRGVFSSVHVNNIAGRTSEAAMGRAGARSALFCLFIEHKRRERAAHGHASLKEETSRRIQSEFDNNMCCAGRTYFLLIALPNDLLLIVLIKKA